MKQRKGEPATLWRRLVVIFNWHTFLARKKPLMYTVDCVILLDLKESHIYPLFLSLSRENSCTWAKICFDNAYNLVLSFFLFLFLWLFSSEVLFLFCCIFVPPNVCSLFSIGCGELRLLSDISTWTQSEFLLIFFLSFRLERRCIFRPRGKWVRSSQIYNYGKDFFLRLVL